MAGNCCCGKLGVFCARRRRNSPAGSEKLETAACRWEFRIAEFPKCVCWQKKAHGIMVHY